MLFFWSFASVLVAHRQRIVVPARTHFWSQRVKLPELRSCPRLQNGESRTDKRVPWVWDEHTRICVLYNYRSIGARSLIFWWRRFRHQIMEQLQFVLSYNMYLVIDNYCHWWCHCHDMIYRWLSINQFFEIFLQSWTNFLKFLFIQVF